MFMANLPGLHTPTVIFLILTLAMERPVDINSKDYAFDVLTKFNSFRKDNKFCDFIIKAGKTGIPVHRCVVAAGSEYFDAMLSHDTKECREGIVVIEQADPESVEKCVDFMYTGKANVSEEKQGDLLHVAHMLQLHRLYNGIALFLEQALDCESFFSTREIANLYSCDRLVGVCNDFALKNFRAIAKIEDFKKIEAKYIDFLLSSERLKESDRTKCKALMVWINYDSSRAAQLFGMMKHIEFMNIPLSYRRFLMDKEPSISESNECLKLLMKSILDGEKVTASDASLDPGIVVVDHHSKKLQCLDIENAIWTEMQDINENMAKHQCSVVVRDDYMYVMVADRTNYRIKYQECQANWETLAKRTGNWGLAVTLQDHIYVTDNNSYSNRIERYSTTQNQWTFITNRTITVLGSAIAVAQGSLFLFGGRNNGNTILGDVHKFEPSTSTWTNVAALGQARYNASATTLDDAIFIFGGHNASNSPASNFEIFHPNSNTAELVTLPNLSRQTFNSFLLDGMIYLVGGNTRGIHDCEEAATSSRIDEYLIEPRFDLDGKATYGDYASACIPPGNRHFIPRRAKLKAAGGRSISLYEKWRLMQYHTNCIMKRFMDAHSVNVSVLPPCVNYDLWKHPKWKLLYDKPLDEDPCPDCDVRFSTDSDGIYRPKVAPASILLPGRWRRRLYLNTIILIGLPQHITVAYIKETPAHIYVEYVDPAGPSGDRRGSEEVRLWMHHYLSPRLGRPIKFFQAAKGINFQSDKNDVMCQTWIWYWVYFRLVRNVTSDALARHIYHLGIQGKSLQRIHRYNCWLSDLYKLGFYTSETASQTKVAIENTPAKPVVAGGSKTEKKRSRMQVALKKMIRKTSTTCFSKTYAYESTDSDSERDDSNSMTSSCTSDEFGILSADDMTE